MAKKPAKTAQKVSVTPTRTPIYWVFDSFEGKGKVKMPIQGFTDLYDAQMFAEKINGYVIDITGKEIKNE